MRLINGLINRLKGQDFSMPDEEMSLLSPIQKKVEPPAIVQIKPIPVENKNLSALLPSDVARVVCSLLDPKVLADAQGRVSLAKQYTYRLGFEEDLLEEEAAAQAVFLKGQKSVEKVLMYLLRYHPTFLTGGVKFRYLNLRCLMLSNPLPDAAGCYAVDLTGADYAALKRCFSNEMESVSLIISSIIASALMLVLFGLLYAYTERNLMFCPAYVFFGVSLLTSQTACQLHGNYLGMSCDDFPTPPDICLQEHALCPVASTSNASWVPLSPDFFVCCSFTNQVGFIVGIVLFSLLTPILVLAYACYLSNDVPPIPVVLKDNWKNVQSFFAKNKASYTVPPLRIDPNAEAERIMVVSH